MAKKLKSKKASKKAVTKKKAVKKAPAKKKTVLKKASTKTKKALSASARKKPAMPAKEKIKGLLLGSVEDYFSHVGVVALTVKSGLNVGDTIRVKGYTTDLTQKGESMQIDHIVVTTAKKGDGVGIHVSDKCRKGDKVYKL